MYMFFLSFGAFIMVPEGKQNLKVDKGGSRSRDSAAIRELLQLELSMEAVLECRRVFGAGLGKSRQV